LSKADLLGPGDRDHSIQYISNQVGEQLGLSLSVFPVSTKGEHVRLLDDWFEHEIRPLCERHLELAQQSVRRKIGALREGVEAVLKLRTELAGKGSKEDREHLRRAEIELRKATGNFEEVTAFCHRAADEIRLLGRIGLSRAAIELAQAWRTKDGNESAPAGIVSQNLAKIAVEGANQICGKIQDLSQTLSRALADAANTLGLEVPRDEDLTAVAKEMPRLDPGPLQVTVHRDLLALLGKAIARRRIERKLEHQIGLSVDEAFERYGRMLESWSRRTLAELHRQFDAHADGYRAQIERLTGESDAGPEESEGIRRDLATLSRLHSALPVPARKPD
jgi:hypothetical protein